MRRRQKLPAGMFGSEAELCQALIDAARVAGYQVHPEVGTWDLLIICRETADQIGVHAKLRSSLEVVDQALQKHEKGPGPEVHAVLVPVASRALVTVARSLRIQVLQGVFLDRTDLASVFSRAPRWEHPQKEWFPEVEMRFPAGVPSPRRMTPWKMAAVKLCLLARKHGYVTRADMKQLNLNPSWWLSRQSGPLLSPRPSGLRGEYVLRDPSSPMVPDFKWPEIVSALQGTEKFVIPAAPKLPAAGPRMRVKRAVPVAAALEIPRSTILPPPMAESLKPVVAANQQSLLYVDSFMKAPRKAR